MPVVYSKNILVFNNICNVIKWDKIFIHYELLLLKWNKGDHIMIFL